MNYDTVAANLVTKDHLIKAKPENVTRLAKALKINVEGMSKGLLITAVAWRLTQRTTRFASPDKRAAYEAMW